MYWKLHSCRKNEMFFVLIRNNLQGILLSKKRLIGQGVWSDPVGVIYTCIYIYANIMCIKMHRVFPENTQNT